MAFLLDGRQDTRQSDWWSHFRSSKTTSRWAQQRLHNQVQEHWNSLRNSLSLFCRFAIQQEDADACFPPFEGGQGGMGAYRQQSGHLDMMLQEAFLKDIDNCGLSRDGKLQRCSNFKGIAYLEWYLINMSRHQYLYTENNSLNRDLSGINITF